MILVAIIAVCLAVAGFLYLSRQLERQHLEVIAVLRSPREAPALTLDPGPLAEQIDRSLKQHARAVRGDAARDYVAECKCPRTGRESSIAMRCHGRTEIRQQADAQGLEIQRITEAWIGD